MTKYNVYLRKDGRWEGRIARGKTENGKRKYQYIFAKTKEEVIRRIDELVCNTAHHECRMSFRTLYSEWCVCVKYRIKESTFANYVMKAKKHILPYFGKYTVNLLNSERIAAFIDSKMSEGLSSRYISDIVILLKTILKYAVKHYHIKNPMDNIELPKKKKAEITILDESEQTKLQDYISKNHNHSTLGTALSMTTGIRIGELCALQWRDIDLEKRILTVRKTMQRIQCPTNLTKTKLIITDPKSQSSRRKIPIPECMVSFLAEFKAESDSYVLTGTKKPIEPRTMQYRFRTILNNVKLPSIHFHALRHIFASSCISLGFDVKALSELLGHSSVEITLNRYVHSSFDQKRAYMNRIKLSLLAKD